MPAELVVAAAEARLGPIVNETAREQIQAAVVVVVEDGAAGRQRFRQIALSRACVVVYPRNAAFLRRDFFEYGRGARGVGSQSPQPSGSAGRRQYREQAAARESAH